MISHWMISLLSHKTQNIALCNENLFGSLSVYLIFFKNLWRVAKTVIRFSRNGIWSFLWKISVNIRTQLAFSCRRTHFTHFPELFEMSNNFVMIDVKISSHHSGCTAFVFFYGRQVSDHQSYIVTIFLTCPPNECHQI